MMTTPRSPAPRIAIACAVLLLSACTELRSGTDRELDSGLGDRDAQLDLDASRDLGAPFDAALDLGSDDLGSDDLGAADLGGTDLGATDLGATDLGTLDLGVVDLGPSDLGPPDLGPPDLGPPPCGNGIVAGPETCDDGFTQAGDGCSATCFAEPGFSCFGAPSVCSYTATYAGAPVATADMATVTVTIGASVSTCLLRTLSMSHAWNPNHTAAGDLTMDLLAPSGAAARLMTGGGSPFDTRDLRGPYDFGASGAAWPPTGTASPIAAARYLRSSLSALLGTPATGMWRLQVLDGFAMDSGSIFEFSVTFTCETR